MGIFQVPQEPSTTLYVALVTAMVNDEVRHDIKQYDWKKAAENIMGIPVSYGFDQSDAEFMDNLGRNIA